MSVSPAKWRSVGMGLATAGAGLLAARVLYVKFVKASKVKLPHVPEVDLPEGETGYTAEKPRRSVATFVSVPEPPVIGEPWKKLSFTQRVLVWSKATASDLGMPAVVYGIYITKMALYAAGFYYGIRDKSAPLMSEINIKKLLVYTIIGDVLGTNSTWGILGMRMKTPFVSAWHFLTQGTLTVPLVPGLPGTRGKLLVAQYVAYVGLLARCLFLPKIDFYAVAPPLAVLATILPQDLVIFLASRGEHYVYFLVSCLFPSTQWVFGCQVVQLALWGFAGTSKLGPWFKYVSANMVPNSVFLRAAPIVAHTLHRSPTDPRPSVACNVLSHFGTVTEMLMAAACALLPEIGVPLTISFHCYIASLFPVASVMEWNMFCIWHAAYLFWFNRFTIPANLHPGLAAFLVTCCGIVPVIGQLYPKLVPFLIAYRPYAGNWRFSWHVVSKAAAHKLERLKTLDTPNFRKVHEQTVGKRNPLYAAQSEYCCLATHVMYPHYRPFVPIIEELQAKNGWDTDDFHHIQQEYLYNCIFGWSLASGFYTRPAFFKAVQEICQFEKGEYYVMVSEPMGLLDHTAEWWVVDVTEPDKKIIHGSMPYEELEKMPIAGVWPKGLVNTRQ